LDPRYHPGAAVIVRFQSGTSWHLGRLATVTPLCTDGGRTSGGRLALWRDAQAEKGSFPCHGDDPSRPLGAAASTARQTLRQRKHGRVLLERSPDHALHTVRHRARPRRPLLSPLRRGVRRVTEELLPDMPYGLTGRGRVLPRLWRGIALGVRRPVPAARPRRPGPAPHHTGGAERRRVVGQGGARGPRRPAGRAVAGRRGRPLRWPGLGRAG